MTCTLCRLASQSGLDPEIAENDHSHWRAFKDSLLTHSSAHYLNVIGQIRKEKGYVRLTDVARSLGTSKASASQGISQLKAKGYVLEDEARMLSLSEEGERIVSVVEHNYMIVSSLFNSILGVDVETARTDACKIEHLLSPHTSLALACLLKAFMEDEEMSRKVQDRVAGMLRRFRDAKSCPFSEDENATDCPYIGKGALLWQT